MLIACIVSAAGLVLAGYAVSPAGKWLGGPWAIAGLSIAAMGFYGSKGPTFAMPSMFLRGTGLAAGFAWINSLGNLGGTIGPYYTGYMKDLTGDFSGGLYGLALMALMASIVCWLFLNIKDTMGAAATAGTGEGAAADVSGGAGLGRPMIPVLLDLYEARRRAVLGGLGAGAGAPRGQPAE